MGCTKKGGGGMLKEKEKKKNVRGVEKKFTSRMMTTKSKDNCISTRKYMWQLLDFLESLDKEKLALRSRIFISLHLTQFAFIFFSRWQREP